MVPQIYACYHGLGHHRETVSHDDYKAYLLTKFIQAIFASVSSLGFLKISIALALLRLELGVWYKRILYALIGMLLLSSNDLISQYVTNVQH